MDTPGFAASLERNGSWHAIIELIEQSFESYMDDQSKINRETMVDNRIHVCLYFVAPTGRGLKPFDLEVLKSLNGKVNIIPVIGKADGLTISECAHMRIQILADMNANGIRYFMPAPVEEDGDTVLSVPYAVACSTAIVGTGNRRFRGRIYPWGFLEVENLAHSDFTHLRNILLRTSTQELIDTTGQHYERFRTARLSEMVSIGSQPGSTESIMSKLEQERVQQQKKVENTEAELNRTFSMKVQEKQQRMDDQQAGLAQQLYDMKQDLIKQQR